METVLKVEEVAAFLKTTDRLVTDLLEDGQLVGFKIGEEWRVLGIELIHFLNEQMQKQQSETLMRRLSDPSLWATEISKDPDFRKEIESQNFQDGTMGAFLKDGLRQLDALKKAKSILKSGPDQSPNDENNR